MTSNIRIQIRVTKNQLERIKNNAAAKGFKTISEYIRSLSLGQDQVFEHKFNELYTKLMNTDSNGGINKNF